MFKISLHSEFPRAIIFAAQQFFNIKYIIHNLRHVSIRTLTLHFYTVALFTQKNLFAQIYRHFSVNEKILFRFYLFARAHNLLEKGIQMDIHNDKLENNKNKVGYANIIINFRIRGSVKI